jgi:NTP pyrophosphatase (non-canonical NTP hydrolase)
VDLARLADEVEEVSRGYAQRHGINRDDAWFLLKLQEEVGELTQAFLMRSGQARSKGYSAQEIDERFRAELADVLCHALLMARHHVIPLLRA